jgi:hypothetical protein
MKINIFCKTVFLAGLVLIFSCNQDPIFYIISTEPAPVRPRIQGSPTNMVVFVRNGVSIIYVASGSLHWYANLGAGTKAEWDLTEYKIEQPSKDKIIGLAATKNYLYSLSISDSTEIRTVLQRIGHTDSVWEVVENYDPTYTNIQTIFADPEEDMLFAGVMNKNDGDNYGILYLLDDNASEPKLLIQNTKELSGAVFKDNTYFLSTRGTGIFRVDSSLGVIPLSGGTDKIFMGMIKLNDNQIIAVERDGGAFFQVDQTGLTPIVYSNGETVKTDRYATGALWSWKDSNDDPKILTAGIQGDLYNSSSSYTYGYVEFDLDLNGSLNPTTKRPDGNTPNITVRGFTDRYTATIGKHAINHFFQAPFEIDENRTFFASTQTSGLWSFRERSGGWQWNAEN